MNWIFLIKIQLWHIIYNKGLLELRLYQGDFDTWLSWLSSCIKKWSKKHFLYLMPSKKSLLNVLKVPLDYWSKIDPNFSQGLRKKSKTIILKHGFLDSKALRRLITQPVDVPVLPVHGQVTCNGHHLGTVQTQLGQTTQIDHGPKCPCSITQAREFGFCYLIHSIRWKNQIVR